ncbi:type II toxin-antitoxin system RelE/ParE family toxin [Dyadobacter sandarakinus]|uniref:Type II toxin-antitoxin system RelE/ParE family toxin n=1 Tax=Dyadobacter sandarakinus TaxID=2747268 RepID=A0ABX7IAA5_9BACT|nr:type II toxin-antitoxin system RelE/ParE family toxin [Dyadobacter sandarakinus]
MNKKYQIVILKTAQKEIKKLQTPTAEKIFTTIRTLATDPRPSGCKKLVATKNSYRIRVGNFRILYTIEDQIKIVEVSGVKHRREAYD